MIQRVDVPTRSKKSRGQIPLLDPCESRTVFPNRRRHECNYPIIAVSVDCVLYESGEITSHSEFVKRLADTPRSIIITHDVQAVFAMCNEHYKEHPRWNWRVISTSNIPWDKGRKRRLRRGERVTHRVSYFGFKNEVEKKAGCYFLPVDASTFFRIDELSERAHDELALLKLGQQIRQFCMEHNLRITPSASGLASQLLRHPMFYPDARRQVPNFINEIARRQLPGNHYDVFAAHEKIRVAMYIDQESAHHFAASHTPMPNSNSICAQGYAKHGWPKCWAYYSKDPDSLYQKVRHSQHGLFCVYAKVPHLYSKQLRYALPYMKDPGKRVLFIWSNELDLAESQGLKIFGILAVYGTHEVDTGIVKYAQWAQRMRTQYPWLKSTLLMTYGLLAKSPGEIEVHTPGTGGTIFLRCAPVESDARTHKQVFACSNVLQRGLIESFTRILSLKMAKYCDDKSLQVVSIYADGIFVRAVPGTQLPLSLEEPWRLKREVTDLEYAEAATKFSSNEMSRFPGTARFQREYILLTG